MTRTLHLTALLLVTLSLTGCNTVKGWFGGGSDAPPPPSDPYASSDPGFQPVEVTPSAGYVEPTPVAPAAPASATPGGTYTIQKGDTFIGIARRVYGNEGKFKDIIAANPGVDPNKLQVGQVINLP